MDPTAIISLRIGLPIIFIAIDIYLTGCTAVYAVSAHQAEIDKLFEKIAESRVVRSYHFAKYEQLRGPWPFNLDYKMAGKAFWQREQNDIIAHWNAAVQAGIDEREMRKEINHLQWKIRFEERWEQQVANRSIVSYKRPGLSLDEQIAEQKRNPIFVIAGTDEYISGPAAVERQAMLESQKGDMEKRFEANLEAIRIANLAVQNPNAEVAETRPNAVAEVAETRPDMSAKPRADMSAEGIGNMSLTRDISRVEDVEEGPSKRVKRD